MKPSRKYILVVAFLSCLTQLNQNSFTAELNIPKKDLYSFNIAKEKTLMDQWDDQGGEYLHPTCNPTIAQFIDRGRTSLDDVYCIKKNGDIIWHRKKYNFSPTPDVDRIGTLNKQRYDNKLKAIEQFVIEGDSLIQYVCSGNRSGECTTKPLKRVLGYRRGVKSPVEIMREAVKLGNRGISKLNKSDNKGAIIDLTKAIELNPKEPLFYLYRGQAISKSNLANKNRLTVTARNELKEAYADFNKVIELDPNGSKGYLYRGLLNLTFQIGDKASACRDFERVFRMSYTYNEVPEKIIRHYGIKIAPTHNKNGYALTRDRQEEIMNQYNSCSKFD